MSKVPKSKMKMSRNRILGSTSLLFLFALLVSAVAAWAQQPEDASSAAGLAPAVQEAIDTGVAGVQKNLDIIWTLLAACLVFWMNAGFAMLEGGFTRAKNSVNIMAKNLMTVSVAALVYWAGGFALMFGVSTSIWTGGSHFFIPFDNGTIEGQWGFTFWMFQVVFAGTAATIVSGAVAERIKFRCYLVYTFVIALFIYPVFGHWAWGNLLYPENTGAWLADLGFIDFAGSTVVHSVGGWAALAGAIVLGPRLGKYDTQGRPRVIPGHSISLATLGVFILFLGWFGFNAGSTTAGTGDTARIAVNTFLSGCAGAVAALFTSWMKVKKPDISMALNGALAGLVAITAPCATVTTGASVLIGLVAGALVVFAVLFFDRVGVDDPVGATSVHLVNGIWGTLAAALLHEDLFTGKDYNLGAQLWIQIEGVLACALWVFPLALLLFWGMKKTIGLRVSEAEEIEGLDLGEHGARAYPDFVASP